MALRFRKNIGFLDQVLRLGISGLMVYFGLVDTSIIADPFSARVVGVLGALNILVALVRFCPLYAVVGINTYSAAE